MSENDSKPTTITDILDQLVRPSVIQVPNSQSTSYSPATGVLGVSDVNKTKKDSLLSDISLPELGGKAKIMASAGDKVVSSKEAAGISELKLAIRTMADDLARLKQGKEPLGFEAKKVISKDIEGESAQVQEKKNEEPVASKSILPSQLNRAPIFSRGNIKSPFPIPAHPIPSPSSGSPSGKGFSFFGGSDEQTNTESKTGFPIKKEIHRPELEDKLPAYLGAPLPMPKKKITKPEDEKIEYGLIARVIGSGMTTGIMSTIIVAIAVYFLIFYLFFNSEEASVVIPISSSPIITATPEVDELADIFKSEGVVSYRLVENSESIVSDFRIFIEKESIGDKEFKKIEILLSSSEDITLGLIDILDKFGIKYPQALEGIIKDSKAIFLYGQQEVFGSGENSGELNSIKGLVFIVEISSGESATKVLKDWELSLPQDFSKIFRIDPLKESTKEFLNNNRQGVLIRYKNFPLPDRSVDYAIVPSLSGRRYLVITNSRESMYSPIDKIRGL